MTDEPRRRALTSTRWHVVLAAGDADSAVAAAALATLCETYWRPVYYYIRHSGRNADDARDLTQGFFALVVEKGYFRAARPERGRFRSFLLTAVRHFLANQADHDAAVKRGGRARVVSIDAEAERDDRPRFEPAATDTPETVYERRWALSALDAAAERLAGEYEGGARQAFFTRARPFLFGDDESEYATAAADLGMTVGAFRVGVHRLRRRFGDALRETLVDTVQDPADVDDEVKYLLRLLA